MHDPIGDLVRAAKPGSVGRSTPLSSRALDELAAYQIAEVNLMDLAVADQPKPSPQHRWANRWLARSLVAAAIVVFIAIGAVSAMHLSRPAFAATPPLPEIEPVSDSATSLLRELAITRRGPATRSDSITTHSWALSSEVGEDGQIVESITEPERIETVFRPDGSVNETRVSAEPFPGQEHEGLPVPGTLLGIDEYAPDEYGLTLDDRPPDSASEINQYLTDFTGDSSLTASQTIREIGSIAASLPLEPNQESALIQYLSSIEGVVVVGRVTDRLGREGMAFSSDDGGDYQQILIVSQRTGALLGIETLYVGQDRTDIPSPAVVYYAAWEDSPKI